MKRKFKSRKRHRNNAYYDRELLLNKKIKQFQNDYYNLSNPPLPEEYRKMDMLRRDIKYLLRCQEYKVWKKSYNRKHAYFDQLTLFKSMYMMWKRKTFSPTLKNTTTYLTTWPFGQKQSVQTWFRDVCSEPNLLYFNI